MIFELMSNAEIEALHSNDSKSFIDYLIDKYDFYKTSDGLVIEFEKPNKRQITKTIWYDDETEAPINSLELFIDYNKHNFINYDFDSKIALSGNHINYNNICCIICYNEWEKETNAYRFEYFKRDLTLEEIEELKALTTYYNNIYLERLKTYYKRFNKHIRVCGYWVNR